MQKPTHAKRLQLHDSIYFLASISSILIGLIVLVGWVFEISAFKSVLPQFNSMKVNTAICICLMGIGTLLNNSKYVSSLLLSLLKLLPAMMVFIISFATLLQYLFDLNFGIDELFFKDPGAKMAPGRLAPITGTMFIFLSLAQFLMFNPVRPIFRFGQVLIFITFIVSFQAMFGYFWGVTNNFGVAYYTQIAFHTTVGLVALSLAMLASRPKEGWIGIMSSDTGGGTMSRQLLIWAIIVPPTIEWINILGQKANFYNEDFGGVLKVTGHMVFFVTVVLKTARAIHNSDLKKREEEKKTRDLLVEQEAAYAIRESETRLRAIFEATFDAILGMNNGGLITDWNIQAEKMFGWERSEVIGQKLSEYIIPEKYREAHENGMKHFLETGEGPVLNKTIEIEALRRNGEVFPIQLSIKPILVNGNYIFMAFIADITDRKKNELELIRAKQNALEAAKSKSAFLANMSHEIRTPLNGIIGMTDLLLETGLDHQQAKYARIVQNSGSGLLSVINDILDFSKIDAGKLNLEILDFNPVSLVEEQAEILATRAGEKGISLLTYVDPSLPFKVKGDSGRIAQILLNLISNAIKFTVEGSVLIKLDGMQLDDENILLKFVIQDTGIGLSSEKMARLFQPFTQADESTARKYGGTGLGLSICKQLVDLMGGQIDVSSIEGKGSIFSFELPLKISPAIAPVLPVLPRPLKILLVDDDPIAREVLSHYLKAWNMLAVEASGGEQALQILENNQQQDFDLVIIDKRMTPMDGVELAARIKSIPKFHALPLIMLSAFDKRHQIVSADNSDFSGFLSKPFKQSDLYDLMTSTMNMGRIIETTVGTHVSLSTEDLSHYRILIAEDNQVNQLLTMTQIKKLGYSAQGVANGKEVLESMKNHAFDLILMDCQMPEMDGFEATHKIREMEKMTGKHIPIVALTANALKEDQENCMRAGMDDFVSKPTKRDILNKVILKWLDHKKGR